MATVRIALIAFVVLFVAGCGVEVRSTVEVASTPCTEAFADAASVPDTEEAAEDLYPAVQACVSMDEWEAAAAAYPDAIFDPDPGAGDVDSLILLGDLCDRPTAGLDDADLCKQLKASCDTTDADLRRLVAREGGDDREDAHRKSDSQGPPKHDMRVHVASVQRPARVQKGPFRMTH